MILPSPARKADANKRKHEESADEKRTKVRPSSKDTIAVLVGKPPEDRFRVGRRSICRRSAYFREALLESSETSIHLPDVGYHEFCGYLEHVESPTTDLQAIGIRVAMPGIGDSSLGDRHRINPGFIIQGLIKSWALGDYLQDTTYQNAVMDEILRLNTTSFWAASTFADLAAEYSAPGSKLREWILDSLAVAGTIRDVERLEKSKRTVTVGFMVELLKRTVEARQDGRAAEDLPDYEQRFEYHVLADGEEWA